MTFTDQLKEQLIDFVESYRKYFLKTFVVAMIFTVLCFVTSAVLIRLDLSEPGLRITNLVSMMFVRYSFKSYQFIDLASIGSFFFIGVFSLLLTRVTDEELNVIKEFTFDKFMSNAGAEDIVALAGTAVIASVIDFLLYKCYWFLSSHSDEATGNYLYFVSLHLRQYIPIVLYALAIRWLTNDKQLDVTFKDILFLFLIIWMFESLANEFFVWVRYNVLDLLLLHFAKSDLQILYQSLFSIPIMGVYFVGYYSALTKPLKIRAEL